MLARTVLRQAVRALRTPLPLRLAPRQGSALARSLPSSGVAHFSLGQPQQSEESAKPATPEMGGGNPPPPASASASASASPEKESAEASSGSGSESSSDEEMSEMQAKLEAVEADVAELRAKLAAQETKEKSLVSEIAYLAAERNNLVTRYKK